MRHFNLIFFIAFIISNCTTENDTITEPQIIGNWNWIESTGGIDGRTDTPSSTGNQIDLIISENSIKKIVNGVEHSNSNYTIDNKQSILFGDKREMLTFENDFNQTFSVTHDQLILIDECTDCFRNVYSRN